MRTRAWSLAFGLALTGVAFSLPAEADVSWSGPGWYVEELDDTGDLFLVYGPYSSEADCTPHIPPDDDYSLYSCEYETQDPTADGGS